MAGHFFRSEKAVDRNGCIAQAIMVVKQTANGRVTMTAKTITIALALLVGATATAAAQSQRNYGPNGPSQYGCYGQAFTGTVASRCPGTPGGPQWQGRPQWQQPSPQPQWQPWQRW
jgi:uncharacterized membrane protein